MSLLDKVSVSGSYQNKSITSSKCKKKMIIKAFVTVLILSQLESSKSDTVDNVDWEEANERCKSQNDSLVSIQDIRDHSVMTGNSSIWSSVKGKFTPWIAYRGCTKAGLCGGKCHNLVNNTVGHCYLECKSKNLTEGGCAGTQQFYFGLRFNKVFKSQADTNGEFLQVRLFCCFKMNTCLCFCNDTKLLLDPESSSCNTLCERSISNGECGGEDGYFSMYQKMTVNLDEASLGGFCLTCRTNILSGRKMLSSTECNDNAYGYCVTREGNGNRNWGKNLSTFDAYWERCRNYALYIVGDTINSCSLTSSGNIWTGLRKYKIDAVINESRCYSIEIKEGKINYRERYCTESHSFLCKQDIVLAQTDVYSSEKVKSTAKLVPHPFTFYISPTTDDQNTSPTSKRITSTTNPVPFSTSRKATSRDIEARHTINKSSSNLEKKKTTIVGASIAGIIVVASVVFLILCFIKRRKLQCLQSEQHQGKRPNVFDPTAQNQRHNDIDTNATPEYDNREIIGKMEEIYIGKEEDEYDHLHSRRQKHMTKETEGNEYGAACYLEDDSYSTLRQDKNVPQDPENEYNTMPSMVNSSSSVVNAEYDFCYQLNQRKDRVA